MRNLLSTLATFALLFSMPALAAELEEKAECATESTDHSDDTTKIETSPVDVDAPPCRGGGG